MRRLLAVLTLAFALIGTAAAAEQIPIYYQIYSDVQSRFYTKPQVDGIVKRCIDSTLPSYFVRSYDEEEKMRIVVWITMMDIENRAHDINGTVIATHWSIRTYPFMMDALMPELPGVGVTGDEYDSSFVENYFKNYANGIFGQFDKTREQIVKWRQEGGDGD